MARDDYVPEALIRSLKRKISGFSKEPEEVQHHLANLIWHSTQKRRRHKTHEGYMSISYQELYGKFGRTGFKEVNDRLGLFEVLEHWSKKKNTTKGYKLAGKAQTVKSQFLNANIRRLDNLIGGDGRKLRTPPKAVASKNMKGITASKWKHTEFKSTVAVDMDALRSLRKHLRAIKRDMEAGHWAGDLFFREETPKQIEYCLEVIGQILRMARTTTAGQGYVIHRYVESKAGRLYAKNINLQTTPTAVKQASLHGLWEYDFENCHYAIFKQLAEKAGIECRNIADYLERKKEIRQQIAHEVQITEKQAKTCLIAIMYGARQSQWHTSAIPQTIGDKAAVLYRNSLFAGLMDDINKGRKAIISNWQNSGRTTYMNAMGKRIGKKEKPEEILAHLIQGEEAKMLHIALDLYPEQIVLLQHDGFATSERINSRKISSEIKKQTGFDMALSEEQIHLSEEIIFSKT